MFLHMPLFHRVTTGCTMPTERLFVVIQHKKQDGKKVWCCGVAGCEYSHAEAEAMETHISQQHTAECLAADLLWLNTRGEDVVPDHCACSFSRMYPAHGERASWVRVSAVVSAPLWHTLAVTRESRQRRTKDTRSVCADTELLCGASHKGCRAWSSVWASDSFM